MSERPARIQLRRTRGWRMPPNTVKVARPSRWGNPFVVGKPHPYCLPSNVDHDDECARPMTAAECVECFRALPWSSEELAPLRGRNLACWCPLDQTCHADVLLELANAPGVNQ